MRFSGDSLPAALGKELELGLASSTLSPNLIQNILTEAIETGDYMKAEAVVSAVTTRRWWRSARR